MAFIDLRHSTVSIVDGTPTTPNSLDINVGEGNLSFTEARTIEYRLNRGVLDTVREGADVPLDLSFDILWNYLSSKSGATVPTPEEALKKTGAAAAWVSSSSDLCEPYAVDIKVVYDPNCGTGGVETITFRDFRWESLDHSIKDGTIACKGKCNVRDAIAVRS